MSKTENQIEYEALKVKSHIFQAESALRDGDWTPTHKAQLCQAFREIAKAVVADFWPDERKH